MTFLDLSGLLLAARLTAASGLPDAGALAYRAERAHLPAPVVWAIAWQETRANLDPLVRGRECVRTTAPRSRARADCEIGRFQIKPSTARSRCPGVNVRTRDGNASCFLSMFAQDVEQFGIEGAIAVHHAGTTRPRSERARRMVREYRRDVLARAALYYVALSTLQLTEPQ